MVMDDADVSAVAPRATQHRPCVFSFPTPRRLPAKMSLKRKRKKAAHDDDFSNLH
jgi:hypothetical protein